MSVMFISSFLECYTMYTDTPTAIVPRRS